MPKTKSTVFKRFRDCKIVVEIEKQVQQAYKSKREKLKALGAKKKDTTKEIGEGVKSSQVEKKKN